MFEPVGRQGVGREGFDFFPDEIVGLFQRLNREKGLTILYVTHDPFIARHTNRIIRLEDGKIVGDIRVENPFEAGTPRTDDILSTAGNQPGEGAKV